MGRAPTFSTRAKAQRSLDTHRQRQLCQDEYVFLSQYRNISLMPELGEEGVDKTRAMKNS